MGIKAVVHACSVTSVCLTLCNSVDCYCEDKLNKIEQVTKLCKRYNFIALIERDGFFEYFDCRKDSGESQRAGYGGNNFSWSAALLLDLLKD